MRALLPCLSLLFLSSAFFSCKTDGSQQPVRVALAGTSDSLQVEAVTVSDTDVTAAAVALLPDDPEREYFDSMMKLEVVLPSLLDETAFDTATVNTFTRLASSTKGEMKLLVSAKLLQDNILHILCNRNTDYSDVLFLIDNTGSMSDDIVQVKEGITQFIDALKEKKQVRLAIGTYGDKQHDKEKWFSFASFERDYDSAKRFVQGIRTGDGGDLPESVYEAFFEVSKQNFWQSRTNRMVLIIGDAHGKDTSKGGEYTVQDVLRKASESRIKVNFFPIIITPYSQMYRAGDAAPQPATATRLIDRVYPNPAVGPLYIQMAKAGRYHLQVYSMAGAMIEEAYIDGDRWLVETAQRQNGLYTVRVIDNNNQYDAWKFVVQH